MAGMPIRRARRLARLRGNPLDSEAGVVLYHGTLAKYVPSILKHGIRPGPGRGGYGSEGVFLSGSEEGADYWAKDQLCLALGVKEPARLRGREKGKIAILTVTIPKEETKNLFADMEQAEDVGFEGEEGDWRAGLREIGDVRYDGVIPAEWITRHFH